MLRDYHYRRLNDTQRNAYTSLKNAILEYKRNTVIDFIPDIHRAISALKHDCAAELYYINWIGIENDISFITTTSKIIFKPKYLFTKQKIVEYNKHLDKLVKLFVRYKDKSVLCRKVHDWLTMNVRYDRCETEQDIYKHNNHNIVGSLIERKAVCEGISFAYQYILNRFGVDCMTVSGRVLKSEGKYYKNYHAWNVIPLNGKNYHVDVAWDNPIEVNGEKHPTYGYYCLPTKLFQDHVCGYNIKCEYLDDNLFYKANRLFTSAQQLKNFVSRRNPFDCCMLYVSGLSHNNMDEIIEKHSRYNYRIVHNTQWERSGMVALMKSP